MQSHRAFYAGLLLLAGVLAAAELPYAGKWKMNPAKSDFKETTVTYSQLPSGEMQYTAAGMSYTFKVDGKDYPSLFGFTTAWKQAGPDAWQSVTKLNGKIVSTEETKISANGKTMTVDSKGTRPSGEAFHDTALYERVSGGPGLAGKWKTAQVKVASPTILEFVATGSDGLTVSIPEEKAVCNAKFDGKDYPVTGPQVPPGITAAIRKTGARSFEMNEKSNGKEIFKVEYTASADGKTLTEIAAASGTNEKIKVVYDRVE